MFYQPIIFLILLVLIIWLYRDGLGLRKKGVPIYPGLVVSLVILGTYLLTFLFNFGYLFRFRVPRFLDFIYFLPYLIPFAAYLLIRFLKYKKIAALGNPPLPPAPRWAFWLMIAIIFAPIIFIAFVLFSLFGSGW